MNLKRKLGKENITGAHLVTRIVKTGGTIFILLIDFIKFPKRIFLSFFPIPYSILTQTTNQ